MKRTLLAALLALLASVPGLTHAHAKAPALLDLREAPEGQVEVLLKTALTLSEDSQQPIFPDRCHPIRRDPPRRVEDARVESWRLDCGARGLAGARIGMTDDHTNDLNLVLSLSRANGTHINTLLSPATPSFVVPEQLSSLDTWARYVALGIEHLLTGLDHLLFVMGLVLWLRGGRALLAAVTAFTLGHSVTLALATLGYLKLPSAPVELGIALSILYLAVLLSVDRAANSRRGLWQVGVLPASFGLLHGLGFAGALREVGLPAGDVPLALFGFNLGVELGQLSIVAVALLAQRLLSRGDGLRVTHFRWASIQLIGIFAAFWCWERSGLLLS